jgi:hypothetical protein
MNHSSSHHKPYMPPTDRKTWVSRGARISQLYNELLPIILDIQAQHPELYPFSGGKFNVQSVAESDGFMRLIDLVPNVNQVVNIMADRPLNEIAKNLCDVHAPRTRAIFEQANAMLKKYGAGAHALRISDDLEGALNETYLAAKTMCAGKKRER